MSYAESFDKALEGLLDGGKSSSLRMEERPPPSMGRSPPAAWVRDTQNAFDGYLKALGEKRFGDAAAAIKRLETAIGQLSRAVVKQDDDKPIPRRSESQVPPE